MQGDIKLLRLTCGGILCLGHALLELLCWAGQGRAGFSGVGQRLVFLIIRQKQGILLRLIVLLLQVANR